MPACHGSTVRGDFTGRETIEHVERVLQQHLDTAWPHRPQVHLSKLATSSDQIREAGLMHGLIELAIRRPTVADEDAIEVGAEYRCGFVTPTLVLNGVHDCPCGPTPSSAV